MAEGLTTAAITVGSYLAVFIVLQVDFALPFLGTAWMNWAMVGACAGGVVLMLPVAEERRRLAIDVDEQSHSGGGGGPDTVTTAGAVN